MSLRTPPVSPWGTCLLAVAILVLAACCESEKSGVSAAPAPRTPAVDRERGAPAVRFAQLTDPHIFDGGKPREGNDLGKSQSEARQTLEDFDWALGKLKGEKDLEFLVITGDLGLEMVGVAYKDKASGFTGEALTFRDEAVKYLARKLRGLKVKAILFVPGNNDLANEDSTYYEVYRQFIVEVQKRLGSSFKVVNLIEKSYVLPNKVAVVGLDSSTFKNKGCDANPELDRCVNGPRYQERELKRVVQEVSGQADNPVMIVTHIPDLYDPYQKKKKNKDERSWNLKQLQLQWNEEIGRKPIPVFAGHLHSEDAADYGQPSHLRIKAEDSGSGTQFVVCPPVSPKFQSVQTSAQGYLIGEIDRHKVDYRIYYKDPTKNVGGIASVKLTE